MPSEKRIAANRRNAKKSTGPKTDEGKQASAQNAIRHGLLAANPVFPGEDPAEFAAFLQATIVDLHPVGQVQRSIASRIAHLQWKLQRIPHVESAIMGNLVDDEQADRDSDWIEDDERDRRQRRPLDSAQMIVNDFTSAEAGVLAKFQLYEQRLERSLRACLKELRDLRKDAAAFTEESVPDIVAEEVVQDDLLQEQAQVAPAVTPAEIETNKRTQSDESPDEGTAAKGDAEEELLPRSHEEHEATLVEQRNPAEETS